MAKIIRAEDFPRRIAARLEVIKGNGRMLPENRELILEFEKALRSGDTLQGKKSVVVGGSATYRYLGYLMRLDRYWKKPLSEVTRKDVSAWNGDMNTDRFARKSGSPYSDYSKADYRKGVRKFFAWLYKVKLDTPAQFSEVADWLSLSVPNRDYRSLSKEEIDRMVDAVPLREKVLVIGLFDSGCRIQEWLNLRIADILNLDTRTLQPSGGEFFKIRIRPETSKATSDSGGKGRTLSLFLATPLLSQWLHSHPSRAKDGTLDGESRLYPQSYAMSRKILSRAGKRILQRRVWPHLLRHASADYWVTRIKNRYRFCDRFGWAYSSDMPDKYLSKQGVSDEETVKEVEVRSLGDLKEENEKLRQKMAILEEQTLQLVKRSREEKLGERELSAVLEDNPDLLEMIAEKLRARAAR